MANHTLLDSLWLFSTGACFLFYSRDGCHFTLYQWPIPPKSTSPRQSHLFRQQSKKRLRFACIIPIPRPLDPGSASTLADGMAEDDKQLSISSQFHVISIWSTGRNQYSPLDNCISKISPTRSSHRHDLANSSSMPPSTPVGGRQHLIQHGHRYDLVSLGEDEDKITCLIHLVDVMIRRCDDSPM